jgi:hypothetical protein
MLRDDPRSTLSHVERDGVRRKRQVERFRQSGRQLARAGVERTRAEEHEVGAAQLADRRRERRPAPKAIASRSASSTRSGPREMATISGGVQPFDDSSADFTVAATQSAALLAGSST